LYDGEIEFGDSGVGGTGGGEQVLVLLRNRVATYFGERKREGEGEEGRGAKRGFLSPDVPT
jgi:hypothetical protein